MKPCIPFHLLFSCLIAAFATGCQKEDEVTPSSGLNSDCGSSTGSIYVHNSSLHTVQRILIEGANAGSLDPGEERYIEKVPGVYTVQLIGISGGPGCSPAEVHVAACSVDGISCSYETGGSED